MKPAASAPRLLWHVPLAGPCAACGQPATRLEVFRDFRLVWHERGQPCELGNPPVKAETVVPNLAVGVYILPRSA